MHTQESVSCIHGMRVFSMLWTIMVHTYLQTFGISENKVNYDFNADDNTKHKRANAIRR